MEFGRLLIAALLGAAIAVLVGRLWPAPEPAAPSVAPRVEQPERERLDRIEARLAGLEALLLRREVQDRAAPAKPEGGAPANPPPQRAARGPGPEREAEQPDEPSAVARRWQRIVSDFDYEPVDRRWASEAETAIRNAFDARDEDSQVFEDSVLDAVDCRSQQCRIEVVFDDEQVDRDELQLRLAVSVGVLLPRMTATFEEQADGRTRAVYILAAPEHHFPGLE